MTKGASSEISKFDLPQIPAAQVVRLRDNSNGLEVTVVPGAGGEIGSLRLRAGGRWRELLYRAMKYNVPPPSGGWSGRAPLLWPVAGRVFTEEQLREWRRTGERPHSYQYRHEGRTYDLPMHGFARLVPWNLDAHGEESGVAWARCSLADSAETRRMYPFRFKLSVTHLLERGRIVSRYEVTAGRNGRPMPFTIGNHIGVRLPFLGKGDFNDCTLRTPGSKFHVISGIGQFTGKKTPARLSRGIALAEGGQVLDGVIGGYKRGDAWVEVADPNAFAMRVSQRELPVNGVRHARQQDVFFVFYGKREKGFHCPEPWVGRINALNTGKGAISLKDGEKFAWEMAVEFEGRDA